MEEENKSQSKSPAMIELSIPIAIIIAGALIAGAVFFGFRDDRSATDALPSQQPAPQQQPKENLDAMMPITSEDHIRGDINAPVKIVEYSDTECPFCKRFQVTMQQVMAEYEDSGQVAWVYRHFPLDQLHKKARQEAAATECAAELGGNDSFWKYIDRLFEITPSNDGLDPAELPRIAQYVGLDVDAFNQCLSSGKYAQKIEQHLQNAVETGGRGTPWSIVVGSDGKKYPLSGAQPLASIKQLIDIASK